VRQWEGRAHDRLNILCATIRASNAGVRPLVRARCLCRAPMPRSAASDKRAFVMLCLSTAHASSHLS
jgi:hypothetical protein